MAVHDSDRLVDVTFWIEGTAHTAQMRRGQIVHEAIHAALRPKSASGTA